MTLLVTVERQSTGVEKRETKLVAATGASDHSQVHA
jgi:hypothetical protein